MYQEIRMATQPLKARVTVPGSKSMTNRAFLMAALSDGVCELSQILVSDDTKAFINALHHLGIVVQLDEENQSCIIGGGSGQFPQKSATIWCNSAGTTLRFLTAACAAMSGKYAFDGTEQLQQRPIEPLLQVLRNQGADTAPRNAKSLPFTIEGSDGLRGGKITIEGSESGQFVSALLMAAPLAKTPVMLEGLNVVSRPYVDMTCAMMAEFGVLVRRLHQSRFSIPVPQRYLARDYTIEPDLSTASYFFAAAAVTAGQVTIQSFDVSKSKQADAKFLKILEKMGCEMISNEEGLTVSGPKELRGVSVDMRDHSDTFMTLAAIAPFANSPTTITNIGHTRLQESNRITVMRENLEKLQVKAEEGPDWIRIHPSKPQGGMIDSHHDHRIAMSFSVMGLRVQGIEIQNPECVAKSCPNFFKMWDEMYE